MSKGIFDTHRTLGLIAGDQPFHLHRLDNKNLISISLGSSFLTYYADALKIKFLGPLFQQHINGVSSFRDLILTASGKHIAAWHKVKQVKLYEGSSSPILDMLVFGDYLVAFNTTHELLVWYADSQEHHRTITLAHTPKLIVHPPTYLNKILVATDKPDIQLFNVKTGKLIFDFPIISKHITGQIRCISQSPILDILAIGLINGLILIVNSSSDSVLCTMSQDEPVTCLSFSSLAGLQKLATGDKKGRIYIWDLQTRTLDAIVLAHDNHCVNGLMFMPSEPILITTSGGDNAIKQWIFDADEKEPRLLKHRKGFSTPPHKIQFYNDTHILACDPTTIRDLSLLNEHQSIQLSYKKHQNRGKFIAFAHSLTRERDWANIISCHDSSNLPLLWSYENKVIGEKSVECNRNADATCVAASFCGNFGVAGFSDGFIEKYNMQSGLHQLTFQKHSSTVVSVCIDAFNRLMVSASMDGDVKFWDFNTGRVLKSVSMKKEIFGMEFDRNSNLLAIYYTTNVIIIDIRTYQLVREFSIQNARDLSFSYDSKWIAVCYQKYLKIWELSSSRLIDWMEFSSEVLSVSFSPTGEFLATSHTHTVGVYLWANRSFYESILIQKSPKRPRKLHGFDLKRGQNFYTRDPINLQELVTQTVGEVDKVVQIDKMPDEIEHQTLKISNIPYYRTQALYNIDAVKERNKPIEPPKKPEKIPFFLTDYLSNPTIIEEEEVKTEKKTIKSGFQFESAQNGKDFLSTLKECPPSKIELIMLELNDEEVTVCFQYLRDIIDSQTDYDFMQSVLSCFLKIHGDKLSKEELAIMRGCQRKTWEDLEELYMAALSGLDRLK